MLVLMLVVILIQIRWVLKKSILQNIPELHFQNFQTGGTGSVYAGGLGTITSAGQKASYSISKLLLNLSKQDKYTVLNLSLVIHATSTGGARVGCCTIKQT